MNLNSLGIPPQLQARHPEDDFMPPVFNPNCASFWPIAVGKARILKNPKAAWYAAIKEFVKLCERKSRFAFTSDETNNDRILTRMIEARREIVRFVNAHKILDELKTYRVTRTVRMTTSGFCITVDIHAQQVLQDPTVIKVLGLRQANGRFNRSLLSNLTFFVYNEGASLDQRWHFGYDLLIDIFPSLPGKRLATTHEQEKFILETMYLPLVRCYRPLNSMHRLF